MIRRVIRKNIMPLSIWAAIGVACYLIAGSKAVGWALVAFVVIQIFM